jgi:Phasin protein
MARNREILGFNGMGAQIPDAGMLLDAQRAAAENAARMASTACQYTMSLNRAWLEFWSKHLTQYTELPKRFADAQTDFMKRAFGHYQESIKQLSSITEDAQEEFQEAAEESGKAGERTAHRFMDEAKEMGKPAGPKEGRQSRAAEEQREQAH